MPTYSYGGADVVEHFKRWQALPLTKRRLKFEQQMRPPLEHQKRIAEQGSLL